MRGFGDFQRAQMRHRADPRVTEVFKHIRQTIDALEQLVFSSAVSPQTAEEVKPIITEVPKPKVSIPVDPAKLAYTIKEVRQLVGIGRTTLYQAIGANELRAVKRGRKTLVLARDLQAWIDKFQPVTGL